MDDIVSECLSPSQSKDADAIRRDARVHFSDTPSDERDERLAVLIDKLRPAFFSASDESDARIVKALHSLCGSLEGCTEGVSFRLASLLGTFFVEKCHREMTESIRDAGVRSLSVLLECTLSDGILEERIEWRLRLSRTCVEYVCGEDTETGGMSSLVRSIRSACFDLFGSALKGCSKEMGVSFVSLGKVSNEMESFVKYCASVLDGESDPRCLMSLLEILHSCQTLLSPSCQTGFPHLSVFDAVAPYYPVQFTPPPNDVYQISREGLTLALRSILCFNDAEMSKQSLSLFMDRLHPPEEDDETLIPDKMDAVDDMAHLCKSNLLLLKDDVDLLKDLSSVLLTEHNANTPSTDEHKQKLSHAIRRLSCLILTLLEGHSTSLSHFLAPVFHAWNVVSTENDGYSLDRIKLEGYLASVSVAGVNSFQLIFNTYFPSLIGGEMDQGKWHAVLSLFHALRELEQSNAQGVRLHPHPLAEYADRIMDLISLGLNARVTGAVRVLDAFLLALKGSSFLEEAQEQNLTNIALNLIPDCQGDDEYSEAVADALGSYLGSGGNVDAITNISSLNGRAKWIALAKGSRLDSQVAQATLTHLFQFIIANFHKEEEDVASLALGFQRVIENGGEHTRESWTDMSDGCTSQLLQVICNREDPQLSSIGMTKLVLPQEAVRSGLHARSRFEDTHSVVRHLIPAFQLSPSATPFIMERLLLTLPPLTDTDNYIIATLLPLLSATLSLPSPITEDTVMTLLPFLVEYTLDQENRQVSRVASSKCLLSILQYHQGCLFELVVRENVYPKMMRAVKMGDMKTLTQTANLTALLASVSAQCGGPSSNAADNILQTLLDFSAPSSSFSDPQTVVFAKAIGSIFTHSIAVCNNAFWKQRLSYKALSSIRNNPPGMGMDMALGCMASSLPITILGKENLEFILERLLKADRATVGMVCLATLIKLLSSCPDGVSARSDDILTYVFQMSLRGSSEIPPILMSVQCLQIIVSSPEFTISQSQKGDAILCLGRLLDHPSRIVRMAAMRVRNVWYLF